MAASAAPGLGKGFAEGELDIGESGDDELGDAIAVLDDVADLGGDGVEGDEYLAPVIGVDRAEGLMTPLLPSPLRGRSWASRPGGTAKARPVGMRMGAFPTSTGPSGRQA